MACLTIGLIINSLTNEEAESEQTCIKVEKALKAAGIIAEVNDVLDTELDETED
jgi:hypothetical protein